MNNDKRKHLHIVLGPTASGKTDYGIALAKKLNTEIISADSRQIFKELNIGVARPAPSQLSEVKHHLIATHSVTEEMNAGIFEKLSLGILEELFKTHDNVVMVGGSGLYIQAVCNGFDELPHTGKEIRETLNKEFEQNGLEYLLTELKEKDPEHFETIDQNNPHRVIRALEIIRQSGRSFSEFKKKEKAVRNFNISKTGIELPREILYERINKRVDKMLEDGLLDEVKELTEYKHLQALQTVGYAELFEFLSGQCSLETAVDKIKQNTRNYAKRQLTWFRKDEAVKWVVSDSTT